MDKGARPMKTLALRFAAPLQAWPAHSRGKRRPTRRAPTYSGLSGMSRAALGIPRSSNSDPLEASNIVVRVDRVPRVIVDFHSINPISEPSNRFKRERTKTSQMIKMSGGPYHPTVLTHREYLTDGVFLCLIESSKQTTSELEQAFTRPVWTTYLGRKSCLPGPDLVLGTSSISAAELIKQVPVVSVGAESSPREVHWLSPETSSSNETWIDQPAGLVGTSYRSRQRATSFENIPSVKSTASLREWILGNESPIKRMNHAH